MSKEIKTNAMRMLDRQKIPYRVLQYECGEFIDGLHTAEKTGAPVEQSFKTLVTRGKSGQFYVMVIPIAEELDLKQAARLAGEKSLEMIHVKEIQGVTGYVRGGCSPVGMKKRYPTVFHASALEQEVIMVSAGKIGWQVALSPQALMDLVRGKAADIIAG